MTPFPPLKMFLNLSYLLTIFLSVHGLRPNLPSLFAPVQVTTRGPPPASPVPSNVSYSLVVNHLLTGLNQDAATDFLTKMTLFPERYFKSPNGAPIKKLMCRCCCGPMDP